MATETQHQLDLVIDTKRPHWQIVQDILTLYKSAPLYSDGKYKIITDRADLPVRQVFHAGNMLGRAEVRNGKDPAAVNQLTAEFANRNLGYERDVYVLQDSAEVFGLGQPIKNADTSLIGLTRPTEVARRLDFELQRRRQTAREVTFQTGLEAVAVEPGDHCIVGVIMTDFEMGYGGRVLDGTTTSFIADREIVLSPGSNYDLWLWHTDADTPERRTLVGSTSHIRIAPTAAFNFRANSGDRFAIGVQSDDLMLAAVKRVTHNENGIIQIVADEYIPITIRQDCPDSVFATFAPNIPSQPNASASFTGSHCNACFSFTYVSCQGGLTRGITSDALGFDSGYAVGAARLNNSIHPPVFSSLVGNTLSFVSGANSGRHTAIFSYFAVDSPAQAGLAVFEIMENPVASGTAYYVTFNTSVSGFRVDVSTDGTSMSPIGTFFGLSGCVQVTGVGTVTYVRAVPFNQQGVHNQAGTWVWTMNTHGCFNIDQGPGSTPQSLTTQSLTSLFASTIPGSLISLNQGVQMRAVGLVNDSCVTSESTRVSFGLIYVASTVVNSLVIDLRTGSLSVGTNAPFVLKATFNALTIPQSTMRVSLEYLGAAAGISQVSTLLFSGVMSIDYSLSHSMAFTIHQSHTDTTGAVHSHGCHSVVLDHAEFEILGEIGA